MFLEDGVQRVSEHFGLAGSGFVGADVDFDVRVRASSQVHGLQAVSLFDPHSELWRQKTDWVRRCYRSAGGVEAQWSDMLHSKQLVTGLITSD